MRLRLGAMSVWRGLAAGWPLLPIAGLALLPEAMQAALGWDRAAIRGGEFWRLWSAHYVHFGAAHALSNGLALCLLICWSGRSRAAVPAGLWLAAPPLISLALLGVAPQLADYRGASALVALLWSGIAVQALLGQGQRWLGILMLLALLAKIAGEATGLMSINSLPDGVTAVWQAHLLGGGLGVLWALRALYRPRRPGLAVAP